MKQPNLCAKKLSIGYQNQNRIIAQNINLNLESGMLIGLIGSNGIGKTTLLKTLSGLQKPISGKLFLESKEIQKYDLLQLAKHISMVFTDKLLPSNLSVFDLVALGRQPYTNWLGKLSADDLGYVQKAIQDTQLTDYQDKHCDQISDGQLQKVLIARSLAQNTATIILDEPTTHLDLSNKMLIMKLLHNVAHLQHKCVLFSTHDIQQAIKICDQIIVMTPSFIIQDTPKKHIENSVFDHLFGAENIVFDPHSNDFLIQG